MKINFSCVVAVIGLMCVVTTLSAKGYDCENLWAYCNAVDSIKIDNNSASIFKCRQDGVIVKKVWNSLNLFVLHDEDGRSKLSDLGVPESELPEKSSNLLFSIGKCPLSKETKVAGFINCLSSYESGWDYFVGVSKDGKGNITLESDSLYVVVDYSGQKILITEIGCELNSIEDVMQNRTK